MIAAGATARVEFVAGTAGTFYYAGKLVAGPLDARLTEDTQLNGVLLVDASGGADAVAPRNDRVFVLSWWFTLDSERPLKVLGLFFPITMMVLGVILLLLAILNMAQVKRLMHQQP